MGGIVQNHEDVQVLYQVHPADDGKGYQGDGADFRRGLLALHKFLTIPGQWNRSCTLDTVCGQAGGSHGSPPHMHVFDEEV